jgi:hypothetical protein
VTPAVPVPAGMLFERSPPVVEETIYLQPAVVESVHFTVIEFPYADADRALGGTIKVGNELGIAFEIAV